MSAIAFSYSKSFTYRIPRIIKFALHSFATLYREAFIDQCGHFFFGPLNISDHPTEAHLFRKHCGLTGIAADTDHQFIKQRQCTLDDINMPDSDRIECAGK